MRPQSAAPPLAVIAYELNGPAAMDMRGLTRGVDVGDGEGEAVGSWQLADPPLQVTEMEPMLDGL